MKQYTFTDFVKWALEVINPADISALMSRFGYTDDSVQSIEDAIEKSNDFQQEFGKLLGHWERKNEKEKSRSVNGVSISNDGMTSEDWMQIASQNLNRATGSNIDTTPSAPKSDFWTKVANIFSFTGRVADSFLYSGSNQQQPPVNVTPANSGQNTFLIIIAVVVVIAIGAIIWVSTKK